MKKYWVFLALSILTACGGNKNQEKGIDPNFPEMNSGNEVNSSKEQADSGGLGTSNVHGMGVDAGISSSPKPDKDTTRNSKNQEKSGETSNENRKK